MLRILKVQGYVFLLIILFLELSLRVIYFNLKSDNYFAISSFIGNFQQRLSGKVVTYKSGVVESYDPVLGYTYLSGEHPVHMSHLNFFGKVGSELKAIETVNSEGYRITAHQGLVGERKNNQPELWIFGCSFAYGSYLSDNQTFPWLVQEKLTNYEVKNYSRGGYGQLQYLLQMEALLKKAASKNNLPKLIVLTYMPFHQERNIQSADRLYRIKDHERIYNYKLPAAKLNSKNELEIYYKGLNDTLNKGDQPTIQTMQKEKLEQVVVTKAIFNKIFTLTDKYHVKTLVAVLETIKTHDEVLADLQNNKHDILSMGVNWKDKKNNLLPFDAHPNSLTNQKWSEMLYERIIKTL